MLFTERDGLLGSPKRSLRKYCSNTSLGIIGSIGLVGVVAIIVVLNSSSQSVSSNPILSATENGDSPLVTTRLGKVKGVKLKSRGGRDYNGFYNLPYAQPPIGELRFKAPVPAISWSGTRDCTVPGNMCVQRSRYNPDVAVEGAEDCLHVNLFTPRLPRWWSNPKLPVIVYFFGGAFMHGTANDFNCDYFMDEDVVMVIVESRVGALGYLNTGDGEVRGNMGLKDQVMALKWVQENIVDFGGDPTRVVAFGTSSGAVCAHGHLLSPMSKGLFSGIMSFSGTMLLPGSFGTMSRSVATTRAFADAMNCGHAINSSSQLIDCLRNVTAEEIALGQPDFGPTLELIPEDGDMSDVFFPDTPLNLLLSGQDNKVPWIVGVNSAESILDSYSLLLDANQTASLNADWLTELPELLFLNHPNQTLVQEITREIHSFYFQNQSIDPKSGTRFNLTNLISDRTHYHPTKTAGLNHAKQSPVYWYYLTKEANVSFADAVTQYFDPPYGVSHADEVQYFFSRPRYPYIPLDSEYADFSILLVKLWVSFAKTGAPVNPDPNGVPWPPVVGNGTTWYNLDDVPQLVEPFTERMRLWDSFPFDLLYNYNI